MLHVNHEHHYLDDEDRDVTVTLDLDEDTRCDHCGETVVEYTTGWEHEDTGEAACRGEDHPDGHRATPAPSVPGNWASIATDQADESVRVSISIGDPRGALQMTLRRWTNPDTGKPCLLLNLPHPDDSTPHVALTEHYPGVYIIGG